MSSYTGAVGYGGSMLDDLDMSSTWTAVLTSLILCQIYVSLTSFKPKWQLQHQQKRTNIIFLDANLDILE